MIIISNFLIRNSFAAAETFEPEFGWAPKIDGDIDKSEEEWENASKEEIFLKSESQSNVGLPVDIWVLQNESDLYISVQFELEESARTPEEFIGIVISESDSENEFYDVKLVQFSNLGGPSEKFEYLDLHISNNQYFEDRETSGDGAAELDGNKIIYEFQIPVNDSEGEDTDDVTIDFGETYAFKIIYGESNNYPDSIKLSNIIEIDIRYPEIDERTPEEKALFIVAIIAFSTLGGFYGFYLYNIVIIKKKVIRVRG
jgi:hypothetical protein